ncbi:hypothetical protein MRB53_005049 [Persea americana]|uniref:Uncharacterized protein n=1 Tax=Persea americana TaxID=3435 RepID=A0ACC2MBX6_PERAE|nr:hypothetical protein MRB53_005049 [Persea americana]
MCNWLIARAMWLDGLLESHSLFLWGGVPIPCLVNHQQSNPAFCCIWLSLRNSWKKAHGNRDFMFGFPETSWRCKCPFQQPPPLMLAVGVEPAPSQFGDEQRMEYLRKRLTRKRLRSSILPVIPFIVPNMLLLLLLMWNPLSLRVRR